MLMLSCCGNIAVAEPSGIAGGTAAPEGMITASYPVAANEAGGPSSCNYANWCKTAPDYIKSPNTPTSPLSPTSSLLWQGLDESGRERTSSAEDTFNLEPKDRNLRDVSKLSDLRQECANPQALLESMQAELCLFGLTREFRTPEGNGGAVTEDEFSEKVLQAGNSIRSWSGPPSRMAEVQKTLTRLGVGIACKKARKPGIPNQDNVVLCRTADLTLVGVADGHGQNGHWASHWVVRYALRLAMAEIDREGVLSLGKQEVMNKIYRLAHEALQEQSREQAFEVAYSGTTLSLCVIDHKSNQLVTSCVGDSACILVRPSGLVIENLTTSHKPEALLEQRRIYENGGEVIEGRVWCKGEDYPGLAMSRSLGDVKGHTCGVICEPSVRSVPFEGITSPRSANLKALVYGRHILLCCSDGVWDFIEASEAAVIVRAFGPERAQEAASALAAEAKERWLLNKNGTHTDDITAVVVWI